MEMSNLQCSSFLTQPPAQMWSVQSNLTEEVSYVIFSICAGYGVILFTWGEKSLWNY